MYNSKGSDHMIIYTKRLLAIENISEIPLDFMLALSEQVLFNNDRLVFFNNKDTRQKISDCCSIGDNMISKYIKRMVDKGILFTMEARGVYEENSCLIAKGNQKCIRKLQSNFQFIDGKWQRKQTQGK